MLCSRFFVVCVFWLFAFGGSDFANGQTLEQTIQLALQHSSSLLQHDYQTQIQSFDNEALELNKRPKLELQLQRGFGEVGTDSDGADFVQSGARRPLSAILNLSYSVDIWGRNKLDLKSSEAKTTSLRFKEDLLRNQVTLDAVDVYTSLAQDQIKIEEQKNNLVLLEKEIDEAKKQLAVGVYTKPYVEAIVGKRLDAEAQLLDSISSFSVNGLKFQHLTGQTANNIERVLFVPEYQKDVSSLQAQIDISPQISFLRSELEISRIDAAQRDIAYRSSVNLLGNTGIQEGSIYLAQRIENYEVLVRFNIPIYNGAQRSSENNKSQRVISLRQEELNDARNLIQSQLMQLLKQDESIEDQKKLLKNIFTEKEVSLDATVKEYNVGKSTELVVMRSRHEKLVAANRLVLNRIRKAQIVYQIRGLLGLGLFTSARN